MNKTLLTICLLVAFFTLANTSSDTVVMRLFWYDHGIEGFPKPACFATAEVKAGKEYPFNVNYNGTIFGCSSDQYFKRFETRRGDHRTKCVWDGTSIQVVEDTQ
jgi:hypothetical protein